MSLAEQLVRAENGAVRCTMHWTSWFAMLGMSMGVTMALTGCEPTDSIEPLYTNAYAGKEVTFDEGLVGEWVFDIGDLAIRLTFGKNKDNEKAYSLTAGMLGLDSKGRTSKLNAVLVRLGDEEFLDLAPASEIGPFENEFFSNAVRTHTVFRVKRDGDVLRLWFLDDDWVKKEVPEGKRVEQPGQDTIPGLVVMLSTLELQTLVVKASSDPEAFPDEYRFARIETVASYNNLLEVAYSGLGKKHIRAGQYEKAVTAWQRYLEVRTDDFYSHSRLSFALLASGDGPGARKQVLEWMWLCHEATTLTRKREDDDARVCTDAWNDDEEKRSGASEHLQIGLTYFTEAKYNEAAREFEEYLHRMGANTPDHDGLLYNYIALRSTGRKDEAERLMQHYKPAFKSSLYADYLQGNLDETKLLEETKIYPTRSPCSASARVT